MGRLQRLYEDSCQQNVGPFGQARGVDDARGRLYLAEESEIDHPFLRPRAETTLKPIVIRQYLTLR